MFAYVSNWKSTRSGTRTHRIAKVFAIGAAGLLAAGLALGPASALQPAQIRTAPAADTASIQSAVKSASIGGISTASWTCWKKGVACVSYSGFTTKSKAWGQPTCSGTSINCTRYVAYRLQKSGLYDFVEKCATGSNASSWDERARKCKSSLITVDKTPAKGAVLQFDSGAKKPAPDASGTYTSSGHVAYIDDIIGGYVYVSEAQCGDQKTKRYKVKLTTLKSLINSSGGKIEVIHDKKSA